VTLDVNDTVEFRRALTFGAQKVYAGTRGVITQVIAPTLAWVSVPSLGREVLVPSTELNEVEDAGGVTGAALSAMARFAPGDALVLRFDRHYGNDLVLAGTKGKVTQVVGGSHAALYWVRFKGMNRDVLAPESDLA
jgi:hypothetical protein